MLVRVNNFFFTSCAVNVNILLCYRRLLKFDRNILHVNLAISIAVSNGLFLAADSLYDHKVHFLSISNYSVIS